MAIEAMHYGRPVVNVEVIGVPALLVVVFGVSAVSSRAGVVWTH
ncbi:MAG: hypothetical protein ACYCZM_04425 [Acidimicrobiales bacterium]